MSTPLQTIISDLTKGIEQGRNQRHGFWARFGAGWWGSFVFHFGMIIVSAGMPDLPEDVPNLFVVVAAVAVYSAVFALVLAVGIPKGSLVRHFSYGVILPAFAYAMAGALLN